MINIVNELDFILCNEDAINVGIKSMNEERAVHLMDCPIDSFVKPFERIETTIMTNKTLKNKTSLVPTMVLL